MHPVKSDRREFLRRAAGTAIGAAAIGTSVRAASVAQPGGAPASRARKYVVAMMGTGGRGTFLIEHLLKERTDVAVAYVCDVDRGRLDRAAALVEKLQGRRPKAVGDFRAILDDKGVDALFNVTPDHWHALGTILACQAGKDVYVEKPAAHNVREGQQMIVAARKYDRVVQLGTQTRSGGYTRAAVDYIRAGKLGDVHFVRVLNMKQRDSIGHKADAPTPPGVDYDRWLGPAPSRPFNPNHFHYAWHWFWDYSGGDIINDGVHQIDIARWLIGKDYPKSVVAAGGGQGLDDDHETPDTQVVTWDFGDVTMVFEMTLWTPYMKKMAWELRDGDTYPDWTWDGMRIEVFGSKNFMFFERHGGGWQVFDANNQKIDQMNDHHPHYAHVQNFFDCLESRARPNADIQVGHRSTLLCQIGNISYRLSGRRLEFDGRSERFVGDEAANQMLRRKAQGKMGIFEEGRGGAQTRSETALVTAPGPF